MISVYYYVANGNICCLREREINTQKRKDDKPRKAKKCNFILYPSHNNFSCQRPPHPSIQCFSQNSHQTPERSTNLQRGRKRSGLLQRKCFKWQLTASGLWRGARVFWQNSASILPLCLSFSQPPPNPSCAPLRFPPSDSAVRKVCFLLSHFLPAAPPGWLPVPQSKLMCLLKQRLCRHWGTQAEQWTGPEATLLLLLKNKPPALTDNFTRIKDDGNEYGEKTRTRINLGGGLSQVFKNAFFLSWKQFGALLKSWCKKFLTAENTSVPRFT